MNVKIDHDQSASPEPESTVQEECSAFIADLHSRNERKSLERARNSGEQLEVERQKASRLDSNIKKSSAFVRKLKVLNDACKDSLIKEINSLNLTKYLSEITAALVELKLKSTDLNAYLQVCCELHRRYPDFSALLLEQWQLVLPKTMPEISNHSKLRNDLPLFAELASCGIFAVKESLPVLGNLLKLLLHEKHSLHLNVILNFCRMCGWDYAGLVSRKTREIAEHFNLSIPRSNFLPSERQKGLRTLLNEYFRQQVQLLEHQHNSLRNKEQQNKQLLMTKGEIPTKRKEAYEEARINFNVSLSLVSKIKEKILKNKLFLQKFLQSMQNFSDLLDEDLPKFESEASEVDELSVDCMQESKVNLGDFSLWEDDHLRTFYEQLPCLKNQVPANLYKDSIKEKYRKPNKKVNSAVDKFERNEKKMERENEPTMTMMTDEMLAEKLTKELINGDSDDDATTIEKVLENLQLDSDDEKKDDFKRGRSKASKEDASGKLHPETLLSTLVNCLNRETIDKAALDFSLHLNTKSNRKKLIRTLFTCPRTRLDLLPFYARFTAIVNPIMPLIGADLVYLLKKDFRFHLRKKDQMNIESKVKNIRFIGELTKFQIFPKDETLQCLKILLLDFAHHHIEMACNLLEVCGRFLYLSSDTHHKCNLLLEQMMRKKSLITMQPKYISIIENAFYASCPTAVVQSASGGTNGDFQSQPNEQVTPLSQALQFARHLIHNELNKSSIDRVLDLLLMYSYTDKQTVDFITRCFTEVWNVKYFNIQVLAHCLAALDLHHPEISVSVIDAVLEDVCLMMEINSIKYSQRRIAVLKYLGELYNYKLVTGVMVIDTLYLLINFEVNSNYESFHEVWLNKMTQSTNTIRSSSPEERESSFDAKLLEYGESEQDESDNLFRVRLVCILLDTAGIYITTTSGKKRLQCFLLFFQLYYQRKRSMPMFDDGSFPVATEFLFVDTIRKLKPKFKFAANYGEAYRAVQELLNELAPSVSKLLPKLQSTERKSAGQKDLTAINENDVGEFENDEGEDDDDDDDEEEEEEEDEEEEDDNDQMHRKRDVENEVDRPNGSENNSEDELEESDDDESSDEEEMTDDDDDLIEKEKGSPPLIDDEEDEEFKREFERLITDSLVSRDHESVRHINSDIVIPISKLNTLNKTTAKQFATNSSSSSSSVLPPFDLPERGSMVPIEPKFNVILMTKAKNKPLLRKIEVPSDSQLAIDLREKERAEKREKEMVKKLTLDINERREMEDELCERNVSGGISLNLNRDSRRKYTHLKGVPDADLIFGPTKRR
jgi:regulator of nonsense transcripts 2